MTTFVRNLLSAAMSLVLLAACGGGGGDGGGGNTGGSSPPTQTPTQTSGTAEGVYGGTLNGSSSSDFEVLVLENGEYWSLYGQNMGSIFYVHGFIQGNGTSNNGSFTSSDLRDFGYAPAAAGSLTASYNTSAKTITGSTTTPMGTVQFSGGPIPNSLYNYNSPATLSSVSGSWAAVSSLGGNVTINIAANGNLTLSEGGCVASGTIAPRASGKNVFNVSVKFGAAPCLLPNQTATGIGVTYALATGQTQLIAAVTSAARSEGIAVFGVR